MSDLKYKVGDRFKEINNELNLEFEITEVDPISVFSYHVGFYKRGQVDLTTEQYKEVFIDKYYTKIEENKMNIEENKHHLLWKGTQSLDVMKLSLTKEEYIGFLKGQILKYQLRLGKKDDVAKELKKIQDYTNELNKMLDEESNN
jgi:hypothetical protein